jgi:hypothetical protein
MARFETRVAPNCTTIWGICQAKMKQLDAAGVAAWLADTLKLSQYAAVVKEHAVDEEILLDLAEPPSWTSSQRSRQPTISTKRRFEWLWPSPDASGRPRAPSVGRPWCEPSARDYSWTETPRPAQHRRRWSLSRSSGCSNTGSSSTPASPAMPCSAWSAWTRSPNSRRAAQAPRRAAVPSFAAHAWWARWGRTVAAPVAGTRPAAGTVQWRRW